MTREPPRGVLLVGTPHGGTEILASALCASGVFADPDADPDAAPPSGPLRRAGGRPVSRFNEETLHRLGGSWRSPPSAASVTGAASSVGAQAALVVQGVRGRGHGVPLLLHDPGMCLLLDGWLPALTPGFSVVLVTRHPQAVAGELATHDRMTPRGGVDLWTLYWAAGLNSLSGRSVHVVHYPELVADPAIVGVLLEALGAELALDGAPDVAAASSALERLRAGDPDPEELEHSHATGAEAELWRYLSRLPALTTLEPPAIAQMPLAGALAQLACENAPHGGLPGEDLRSLLEVATRRAGAAEDAAASYRQALAEAEEELRCARKSEREASARLSGVESSALAGAVTRYRNLVEELAPTGSRRRRVYGTGVARVRGRAAPERRPPTPTAPEREPEPRFTGHRRPLATVLIPVHGKWQVTRRCLESLAAAATRTTFQVLVVDDASPDRTRAKLETVRGVEVVGLDANVGFVRACNAGFGQARGRYVVLLNNDVEVRDGWLDALVEAAEADPRIALVGAKLLDADGTLQEAGGITFRDGSGWKVGRGEDPNAPAYQHPRDVDYCSGAALLVRRDLLEAVGGFDERFAPAYYEDVDLAFTARQRGLRVVYEPRSEVVHFEGLSHGTDVRAGIKRHQVINQGVLVDKWGDVLRSQWAPERSHVAVASWRSERGHVLVCDHQVPRPDHDSGSLRMWSLLVALSRDGYAVTFLADDLIDRPPYVERLRRRGVQVVVGATDVPRLIDDLAPDLVAAVLSRPGVAWRYLTMLRERAPGALVVYDTVDLHHAREQGRAQVEGNPSVAKAAAAWRELEVSLVRASDVTLTVSGAEAAQLRAAHPQLRVEVVPNVHLVRGGAAPFAERSGLLFVGNFEHPPNADAARWFVREVLPLVAGGLPGVRLTIAGTGSRKTVGDLEGEAVSVLGWVEDLDPLHERACCFVAPLRYGAGVKGKVGEALAQGLPVVTTRIGAEGMGLEHGRSALVADSAQGFAGCVLRVLCEAELWERLSGEGRSLVARRMSPEVAAAGFRRALDPDPVLGIAPDPVPVTTRGSAPGR